MSYDGNYGSTIGAAAGTFIGGPIGTAVGGVVGGGVDALIGLLSQGDDPDKPFVPPNYGGLSSQSDRFKQDQMTQQVMQTYASNLEAQQQQQSQARWGQLLGGVSQTLGNEDVQGLLKG